MNAGSPAVDAVAAARALGPMISAAAPRVEASRDLPEDVVEALHEARLFRMLFPRSLGGLELPPAHYVQAIEEIAKADASTAWCVAQTSVCSTVSASLDHQVAWELFGADQRALLAWGPPGRNAKAIAEPGGYRVTGSWQFASGSRHAKWLSGHAPVLEADGTPRKDAQGNPVERTFIFPRTAATITDVWHVIGLKGTGTDNYAVTDLFVPEERTTTSFGRNLAEHREKGPLYLFTVFQLFGASFGSVALGIARAALDDFVALAKVKTPTGGRMVLRDNAVIQSQVGLAQAQLASARVFLIDALETIWDGAVQSGKLDLDHRINLRMAATYSTHIAKQVVDVAYHSAGATAIFESNPFERRFRDVHTVSQQVQSHFSIFETMGQHFLGLPTNPRLI